jgi:hypothetical protein
MHLARWKELNNETESRGDRLCVPAQSISEWCPFGYHAQWPRIWPMGGFGGSHELLYGVTLPFLQAFQPCTNEMKEREMACSGIGALGAHVCRGCTCACFDTTYRRHSSIAIGQCTACSHSQPCSSDSSKSGTCQRSSNESSQPCATFIP